MSLTEFQRELLLRLAKLRSPESYVAGGIALHAHTAIRYSADLDLFHDVREAVARSSEADIAALRTDGYDVREELWTPTYRRAWVSHSDQGVRLEWAHDSAWRFWPLQRDELLGWKLHPFDALTNKALALGSRSETRDLVDLVAFDSEHPVHAVVWAACAKDPGFNPDSLLAQMRRHARIDPTDLATMAASFSPVALKERWLEIAARCEKALRAATDAEIAPGLAFFLPDGRTSWFDRPGCVPRQATLAGAVPRIV